MKSKKNSTGGDNKTFVLPKNAISQVNLGQAFSEYDKVLLKPGVFVETPAIKAAQEIDRSKCLFVGRRGTGKTAITLHLGAKRNTVITIHPHLFGTLENLLSQNDLSDVRQKPFHSLVGAFRRSILDEVLAEWVRRKLTTYKTFPDKLRGERNYIEDFDFDVRTITLVEEINKALHSGDDKSWIKQMNRSKEISHLIDEMKQGPSWEFIVAIDRIDDAWNGSDSAVVLLMALMHACVELSAMSKTVHPLLFLRENLFQRVRQLDNEFTRLETAVVSLEWTPELLVEMIERRLRLSINTKPPLGQTWDCYFEPIDGQSSVKHVLNYCQARPRDLLILCNFAIEEAQSHKHPRVTADDLNTARLRFSINRLKDVCEEYSENFPQLQVLLGMFHGLGTEFTLHAVTQLIQKLLVTPDILKYCGGWLNANAAPHRFSTILYSVGFWGIKHRNQSIFRSQGGASEMPPIDNNTHFVIHPCYADALSLQMSLVTSLDDVTLQREGVILDLPESFQLEIYTQRLDSIVADLSALPLGRPGASAYETLIGDVIRLCFFKKLNNVQEKSRDVSGIVVRDWVASIVDTSGFWSNLRGLHNASQVIWECKNYEKLKADDFHQMNYYLG